MYYWGKESNYVLIECNRCGKVLKFDSRYFEYANDNSCKSKELLQCSCGNSAMGYMEKNVHNEKSEVEKERESLGYDKLKPKQAQAQTRCPHCGSTNIQLVRKKWSLVTGLLTNKVERYCVNCKKKF